MPNHDLNDLSPWAYSQLMMAMHGAAQTWLDLFGPPLSRSSVGNEFLWLAEKIFLEEVEELRLHRRCVDCGLRLLDRDLCDDCINYRNHAAQRRQERTISGPRRIRIVGSIVERDGWDCRYCAERLTTTTATIDHVTPRSRGGTDDLTNLVLACARCNSKKGNRSIEVVQ